MIHIKIRPSMTPLSCDHSGHRTFQEVMYKPVNGIVQYEFLFRGYVYIQNELLLFVVLFQHTHVELEVDLLFPMMNPHFMPAAIE